MSVARLHRWHRAVGLIVAIVLVVLAITGLALTFTESLRLDKRFVAAKSLLDWYSVKPPPLPLSFRVGSHWISQVGPRVYFDDNAFASRIHTLHGATVSAETIVIGLDQEIWLLTPDGEIIERLAGTDGVPQAIDAVGLSADGEPVARADRRNFSIAIDDGRVEPTELSAVSWAAPSRLPKALEHQLAALYRGHELTFERIALDLHTGRIFGEVGVAIVTLSTLGMVLLAISGVVTWWRRWRRLHRHHHH